MQTETWILIGIAVLSMFFGYFFGLFEGRGQGYKKRKEEEEVEEGEQLSEPDPVEDDEPENSAETPLPPAPPEPSLLRLSLNPEGRYRLDLDDERVDTSSLTSDQRKRLIALLTVMRPWLDTGKAAQSPPATGKPAPVQPRQAAPTFQTPVEPPTQPPPGDDAEPVAPDSIVSQIDSILQARIEGTPLQGQGISLRESPEGGVLVWIGLNKYQGVDEVPDEQIKSAIQAAIAEWESKYTPGI